MPKTETQMKSIKLPKELCLKIAENAERDHRDFTKQCVYYLSLAIEKEAARATEIAAIIETPGDEYT